MLETLTKFPDKELRTQFPGPAGELEVLLSPVADPKGIGIVCHPHPLFGGTMDNKVVYTIARAFKEYNLNCIRFNYRGVGRSQGSYGDVIGETEDLYTIIEWVKKTYSTAPIYLAGFSFGTYVVLRVAQKIVPEKLITVAPAVTSFNFDELKRPACPWLIVQGEEDEVIVPEAVFKFADGIAPPATLIKVPETGHFFHGKLIDLRKLIIQFLQEKQ